MDIDLLASNVTLTPGLVTSADILPQHRVGIGTNTTLTPQQVSFDTDVFLRPVITHPNILTPLLIIDTDNFYIPSVNLYLLPGLFTDGNTFFVPSVAFPILPNLAIDIDTTFALRIDQAILPAWFGDDDFVFAASGHGFYLPYFMPEDDVFFSPVGSLVFLPAIAIDSDTVFNAASTLGLVTVIVSDNDMVYLSGLATNSILIAHDPCLDRDHFATPDVMPSDMAVDPDVVSDDDEEIFSTDFENDAPAVVFMFEDKDIFYDADIATVWIIADDFFDSDDYTDDTTVLSINKIVHPGGFSLEEIIPAGAVSQTQAISSSFGEDDFFGGSDAFSETGADAGYHPPDDAFSVATFSTDFTLAPPIITINDLIYNPVMTATTNVTQTVTPGRYIDTLESIYQPHTVPPIATLHPPLSASDDMIYAADESARHIYPSLNAADDAFRIPFVGRGRVIASPIRFIDTDNLMTPQVSLNPAHSQLHIDFDIMIPPFTVQRRGVRSNVGIIQGRIDKVPELLGSRDL